VSAPRITLEGYWRGRDVRFASELTPRIRANAALTVERANALLAAYCEATGDDTPRGVNSGWRPLAVNAQTPRAAARSRHLTGEAVDIGDDGGELARWCESPSGLAALEAIGLWMESRLHTPRWLHVQTVAPGSGRRVFGP
jgi:hypothetical protein